MSEALAPPVARANLKVSPGIRHFRPPLNPHISLTVTYSCATEEGR
jgi:hypothetical protein